MSQPIKPAPDNETVLIVGVDKPAREGFIEHGPAGRVGATVQSLREDYDKIVSQLLSVTQNTPEDSSMRLKQIDVGLGFNAEGKLGFIASAAVGVEASITLSFERIQARGD